MLRSLPRGRHHPMGHRKPAGHGCASGACGCTCIQGHMHVAWSVASSCSQWLVLFSGVQGRMLTYAGLLVIQHARMQSVRQACQRRARAVEHDSRVTASCGSKVDQCKWPATCHHELTYTSEITITAYDIALTHLRLRAVSIPVTSPAPSDATAALALFASAMVAAVMANTTRAKTACKSIERWTQGT